MAKNLLVLLILILNACSLDFLKQTGRIPKLDTTDTLAGIDKNKNGIRDDIEEWIEQNYKHEKKSALMQYAKAAQLTVTVDLNNLDEIKKTATISTKAIQCLWDVFKNEDIQSENHPINIRKELSTYTTNTFNRLEHYLKYNQKLNGTTWTLSKGKHCDE